MEGEKVERVLLRYRQRGGAYRKVTPAGKACVHVALQWWQAQQGGKARQHTTQHRQEKGTRYAGVVWCVQNVKARQQNVVADRHEEKAHANAK